VVKAVPHRHFVFSIPKILRPYFLFNRRLLSELSRCASETLKEFFQEMIPEDSANPAAVIATQTFGDFLGFNPHCHVLGEPMGAFTIPAGLRWHHTLTRKRWRPFSSTKSSRSC
jgi:hypothetical protein